MAWNLFICAVTADVVSLIRCHKNKSQYSEPLSNAGNTFLESGALGESALDELIIVWD
jgi:hypothetical protein